MEKSQKYKVTSQNNLKDAIGILRWCAYDQDFIPNRVDVRFREWTTYSTFLHQGTIKNFKNLKMKH